MCCHELPTGAKKLGITTSDTKYYGSDFADLLYGTDWMRWLSGGQGTTLTSLSSKKPYNIRSNEKEIVIEVAAAGFVKEDFSITTKQESDCHKLTIKASPSAANVEGYVYSQKDFIVKDIDESIKLVRTDVSNIKATMANGILYISVPKIAPEVRTIKVS